MTSFPTLSCVVTDYNFATGSGVAALVHTTPPQVIRPDILASMDVSDDNWYVEPALSPVEKDGCLSQEWVSAVEPVAVYCT